MPPGLAGDQHCPWLHFAQPDLAAGHTACSLIAVHYLRGAPALDCLALEAPGVQSGMAYSTSNMPSKTQSETLTELAAKMQGVQRSLWT